MNRVTVGPETLGPGADAAVANAVPERSAGFGLIGSWSGRARRGTLNQAKQARVDQADSSERISLKSNVLGATGFSREALRKYLKSHGLFGKDSDLDQAEQAAVQAVLQPALRSAIRNANRAVDNRGVVFESATDSRVQAVRDFAKAAVRGCGTVSRSEWARARAANLSPAQRSEVLAVVCLIRDSFGL